MAAAAPCRACLRVLRIRAHAAPPSSQSSQLTSLHRLPRHFPSSQRRPLSHALPRSYRTNTDRSTPRRSYATSTGSAAKQVDTSPGNTDLARHSCTTLFKECARQADYSIPQAFVADAEIPKTAAGEDLGEGSGWWYQNLKLVPTFNTWAQITFLHMYLLTVRLRYFSAEDTHRWQQLLHDAFFLEAEHRMTIFHGIGSRSIRNRYLKELYNQWRGILGAYDEGLIKGDAVLAAAVWRNVFKGDDAVDWRDVALVVSFMRRGLKALDGTPDRTVTLALVRFGTPMTERAVVEAESRGLAAPFGPEDEQLLEELKAEAKEGTKESSR